MQGNLITDTQSSLCCNCRHSPYPLINKSRSVPWILKTLFLSTDSLEGLTDWPASTTAIDNSARRRCCRRRCRTATRRRMTAADSRRQMNPQSVASLLSLSPASSSAHWLSNKSVNFSCKKGRSHNNKSVCKSMISRSQNPHSHRETNT